MTTQEAAEQLGYTSDYICKLCRDGDLLGAQRMGQRTWVIPQQSVIDYKPKPRGVPPAPTKLLDDSIRYITVKEAVEILGRAARAVRHYCTSGKLEGAVKVESGRKGNKDWLIPLSSVEVLAKQFGILNTRLLDETEAV